MLFNLHLLRVVAALSVVFFHTTSEAGLNLPYSVGNRGVDVFFVISGFIIAYIGAKNPDRFLLRRMIRVCPFYWAATLVVFVSASLLPAYFRSTSVDVKHLLLSLLFVPHDAGNGVFPTLILGWSLNYELFFYVVFALALLISPRRAHLLCAGAIGLASVIGLTWGLPQSTVLSTWMAPIVLEFVLGIAVFVVFDEVSRRAEGRKLSRAWAALLGVVLAAALTLLYVGEWKDSFNVHRALSAGVPSFFIVLSATLLERLFQTTTKNRSLFVIGEASYILYLVHPYVIYPVLRLLARDRDLGSLGTAALIAFLLSASVAVAVALHVGFERPLLAWLRRKLLPPSPQKAE
jgi:peptidoglycan/LPS O-acetylase OafA/YrhL